MERLEGLEKSLAALLLKCADQEETIAELQASVAQRDQRVEHLQQMVGEHEERIREWRKEEANNFFNRPSGHFPGKHSAAPTRSSPAPAPAPAPAAPVNAPLVAAASSTPPASSGSSDVAEPDRRAHNPLVEIVNGMRDAIKAAEEPNAEVQAIMDELDGATDDVDLDGLLGFMATTTAEERVPEGKYEDRVDVEQTGADLDLELVGSSVLSPAVEDIITCRATRVKRVLASRTLLGDMELTPVFASCTSIVEVDLSRAADISDMLLVTVSRCQLLRRITLAACPQVTDSGVKILAMALPELLYLDISGIKNVTDNSLMALAHNSVKLEELHMSLCSITDLGIMAVAQACPTVTTWSLALCREVTDEGLLAITEVGENVTSLNVAGCLGLSEEGLGCITDHCEHLCDLNVSSLPSVTDDVLRDIADFLPELRTLNCQLCDNITEFGGRYVCKEAPHIINLAF